MTPMRKLLFRRALGSLQAQTSNDWLALVVGDQPVAGPNIVHLRTDKQLKGPKLDLALEYLEQQDHQPRYLIRFDDDDVIAPDILRRVSRLEFDCVADRYHAYYDLTTGKTCLSKNHWMANTVIHKYEHALFGNEENPHPLITRDHSIDWHQYYEGKKVVYITKYNPICILASRIAGLPQPPYAIPNPK